MHDGGHPAEQRLVVDLADGEAVVLVVDQGQVGPAAPRRARAGPARGPPRSATRATSVDARMGMLPKPTYTGGVAGVEERLQLGRERAFVGQDPRAGLHDVEVRRGCGHGPRTGSAASHGRSVKTWSRTLSTGGRPIDARWVLSAAPNSAFKLSASRSHSTRLSVSLRRERPARQRERPVVRRRQHDRAVGHVHVRRMPSFSATDRAAAAAGTSPVATTASHPSAAARARRTARRSARPRAGAGLPASVGAAPVTSVAHRLGRPAPAARRPRRAAPRTPRPAARTPAPRRRVPATPPRAPPSARRPRATRTSTTEHALRDSPFPRVPAQAGDSAARPGPCRKPPGALYLNMARGAKLLAFVFCGAPLPCPLPRGGSHAEPLMEENFH